MSSAPRSLYIHVPFCASACPYCDFTSVTSSANVDAYVDAVCAELRTVAPRADALDTVFLGGGTPSLLSPAHITRILETVHTAYTVSQDCEWTIEANPGSTTPARAAAWHTGGVTRVSIGAQSFDPAVLRTLGRRHEPAETVRAVEVARSAGFTNLSLDMMYGVPGQSLASVRETLDAMLALAPQHVSAYQLTIEASTPFGAAAAAGQLDLPSDDAALAQRSLIEERLDAAGLEAYEISNYARPGFACRHNLTYWEYAPYLGCGPDAVGFDGVTRTRNAADVGAYCAAVRATGTGIASREELDAPTRMFEDIFSGLRLRVGLDTRRFRERFGRTVAEVHGERVAALCAGGFLEEADGRLRLTPRGIPVANEVALRFLY